VAQYLGILGEGQWERMVARWRGQEGRW